MPVVKDLKLERASCKDDSHSLWSQPGDSEDEPPSVLRGALSTGSVTEAVDDLLIRQLQQEVCRQRSLIQELQQTIDSLRQDSQLKDRRIRQYEERLSGARQAKRRISGSGPVGSPEGGGRDRDSVREHAARNTPCGCETEDSPNADAHTSQASSGVNARVGSAPLNLPNASEGNPPLTKCECVILEFNRWYQSSRKNVMKTLGEDLEKSGWNMEPCWAKGALILVEGLTEQIFTEAAENFKLERRHAVVPEIWEMAVIEQMRDVRYSERPRVKDKIPLTVGLGPQSAVAGDADVHLGPTSAIDEVAGGDFDFILVERRCSISVNVPGPITPRTNCTRSSNDRQQGWANPRTLDLFGARGGTRAPRRS